jgi:hypothetical protein
MLKNADFLGKMRVVCFFWRFRTSNALEKPESGEIMAEISSVDRKSGKPASWEGVGIGDRW